MTMQANLTNRDATRVPHPLVKWSYEPPRAEDVPPALARAIHLASLPPKGPAFVSIPMDDWDRRGRRGRRAARDRAHGRAAGRRPTPRRSPSSPSGSTRRRTRCWSRAPTIDASGAWDAAVALAERQSLPVWAIPAPGGGRLGFPEGHPNFQGVLPPAIGPVAETLEGHDLVLVVGASVFPYYPYIPGPLLPEGAALVAITRDPDEAARAPMGDAIVADVALTLRAPAGGGRRVRPRRAEPLPDPAARRGVRSADADDGPHTLAEVFPDDGDRRARVAVEHAGAAQPAADLAARQLLLRRRRRPRLRPLGRGRRAARPARPPGRLRGRRGLGPVRDHRRSGPRPPTRCRSRSSSCATASTRSSSGSPTSSRSRARRGSTCRRSTSPRSPTATASARAG